MLSHAWPPQLLSTGSHRGHRAGMAVSGAREAKRWSKRQVTIAIRVKLSEDPQQTLMIHTAHREPPRRPNSLTFPAPSLPSCHLHVHCESWCLSIPGQTHNNKKCHLNIRTVRTLIE